MPRKLSARRQLAAGRRPRTQAPRALAASLALLLLLLVISGLVNSLPASAANNGNIAISPVNSRTSSRTFFTPVLVPGVPAKDQFVVSNETAQSVTLHLYASDAFTTKAGGFALKPNYAPKRHMGAWIHLPESTLTLPARSGVIVHFTYDPPAKVPPGDYTGGIVAAPTKGTVTKKGHLGVQSIYAVGVSVFGKVNGPLHPRLAVTRVVTKTTRPFISQFGGAVDATVAYALTNTGNENLAPHISVSVSPLLGSAKTQQMKLPLLLPGSTVIFSHTFKDVLPFGHLTSSVVAGSSGVTTSGSVGTVVIPWGLVIIVVLVLVLLLYRRRRRSQRRRTEGEKGEPGGPSVEAGAASAAATPD